MRREDTLLIGNVKVLVEVVGWLLILRGVLFHATNRLIDVVAGALPDHQVLFAPNAVTFLQSWLERLKLKTHLLCHSFVSGYLHIFIQGEVLSCWLECFGLLERHETVTLTLLRH